MATNEEQAAGLRALADHLEATPDLDLYRISGSIIALEGDGFTRQVRLLGGHRDKEVTSSQIHVTRDFGGGVEIKVIANRDTVCTARVVGTEKVEVPDPTVIVPLVTIERDVIEWDCAPVLEPAS